MNLFSFNNKVYTIDVKALMNFLTTSTSNEKHNETSITHMYAIDPEMESNDLNMISKEVSETKTNVNDAMITIRYDFIKYMLTFLSEAIQTENGSISLLSDLSNMTFTQTLCLNTLLCEGIIKELNEE